VFSSRSRLFSLDFANFSLSRCLARSEAAAETEQKGEEENDGDDDDK